MAQRTVDVAVIGAGTAGLTARRAAEKEGASTVLIDPGPLGTTCARTGCMPSKLMIAAADVAHQTRRAPLFGIETSLQICGKKVMERIQKERDRFVASVLPIIEVLRKKNLFIEAKAEFSAPGRLHAGDEEIEAKAIVIATGAFSLIPEPYRHLRKDLLLTSENIFDLNDLPKSILVIGTGIIGLELGQALHRLGVRVRILGLGGTLGPLRDPEIRKEALRIFSSEMDFDADHQLKEVREVSGGVEVLFTRPDGEEIRDRFERVLIAAGRKPNLQSLGLERAGIHPDKEGILKVHPETLQVEDKPVFIAGDANNIRPILHEASDEGHIAGRNAAWFPEVKAQKRKTPLMIVFTDPQIAVVGTGWQDPEKTGQGFCTGEVDYGGQGRSQVMAVNQGKVRLYGGGNPGRLLGAEIIGPAVEHTAHLLSWVIQRELPLEEIIKMPFYHPAIEEGIQTALGDLWARMKQTASVGRACDEYGPGT